MTTLTSRKWSRLTVLRAVAATGAMLVANAAMAGGPACCAPVACDATCAAPVADCCVSDGCGPDCAAPDCCAPAGCDDGACCDPGCEAPAGCCGDSCDGCGSDGCSLFGKKSFLGGLGCGDDSCCDTGCADACDGCGMGCGGGELGDPWTLAGALCPQDDCCDDGCGLDFGGWVQIGYHNNSTGLFNNRPDELNVHQVWTYLEKAADGSDGIGFGGRVDFMYGIDAGDTQAFGNEPGNWDYLNGWDRGSDVAGDDNFTGYGFAMPQLYGEVALGENLSVIAGHFYTLLGYEGVTAPDNFFYSHAFTMYNSEAFTHTGVLATYTASDNLTLYAGWTLGWDTGFDQYNLFGQDGSSFLGGFSTGLGDNASLTYITTFGDLGWVGDGYAHSVVVDVALSDNLNYVFQSDHNHFDTAGISGGAVDSFETIGINQYLFYTLSDRVAVGARAEWWKVDGNSIAAITGGVNIRPTANLIIRPEVRYQVDQGDGQGDEIIDPFTGLGTGRFGSLVDSDGEAIFGIDAIFTF